MSIKSYLYFSKIKANRILRSYFIETVGIQFQLLSVSSQPTSLSTPQQMSPGLRQSRVFWEDTLNLGATQLTSDKVIGQDKATWSLKYCGSSVFKAMWDQDTLPSPCWVPHHHFLLGVLLAISSQPLPRSLKYTKPEAKVL